MGIAVAIPGMPRASPGRGAQARAPVRRWLLAILISIVALAGVLGLVIGCTSTIIPPTDPEDPVSVFLVDHGRTPSLILPRESGDMVRYVYGDWDYYALRRTGLRESWRALLVPTQGALGRRELAGPADEPTIRERVNVRIENLYEIRVPRANAAALLARLDRLYGQNRGTEIESPSVGLFFVEHPEPYTLNNNSNHVAAAWLRELGCRTRGQTFLSKWRIREPTSG